MMILRSAVAVVAIGVSLHAIGQAPGAAPAGEVKGTAWIHTRESLAATLQQANVVLPAKATAGAVFTGKYRDIPALKGDRVPVVLFLHGSSGLGLKAIGEWQQWLATLGVASVAPDSFALPDRVIYSSPIDRDSYEKVHALRSSEIAPALLALKSAVWADPARLILAGASEGGVPVARYEGTEFAARMIYSWSCEANYFVREPENRFEAKPVLNIISATDPFFSQSNGWLGNKSARGHCAAALKDNRQAAVILVPDAPHTLLNLPAARAATAGFLSDSLEHQR